MNELIPLNQTGLAIIARVLRSDGVPENLSTATNLTILLRGPAGLTQTKQASLTSDGTDGRVQYVTQTNDLNSAGVWEYQARYTLAGGVRRSAIGRFRVVPVLG